MTTEEAANRGLNAAKVVVSLMEETLDDAGIGWVGFELLKIILPDRHHPEIPFELFGRFDYMLKMWSMKIDSLLMIREETVRLTDIAGREV
jgi:hypothetical protein